MSYVTAQSDWNHDCSCCWRRSAQRLSNHAITSHLRRVFSEQLQRESVQAVDKLSVAKEHEGALPFNDANTVLMAKSHGGRADGTLSSPAMHPDFANPCGRAVMHNGFRLCRRRHEQGSFHGRFDG